MKCETCNAEAEYFVEGVAVCSACTAFFTGPLNCLALTIRKEEQMSSESQPAASVLTPDAIPKVKVKWGTNYGTAQIYSSGVELSLCSDDNRQIGTFVYCKDFFQDAIVAYIHQTTCSIYGYKYDPKSMPPIPTKAMKILIANAGDKNITKKIRGVTDLINQVEDKLGVKRTTIAECESPPKKYANGIYLMTADKVWMHAPPLLSMWTLLARNGLQHKIGDKWETTVQAIIDGKVSAVQSHDQTYLKYAKPGIDLLLEKGIIDLFGLNTKANYPKNKAGSVMHHYSGAVSFGSCVAKKHFPNWKYPAKASKPPSVCFS